MLRSRRGDGWTSAALTALPWFLVLVAVTSVMVVNLRHLPHGMGWRDSYVYARAASNFLGHPSQIYDGARLQLTTVYPRATFIYPPAGLLAFMPLVPLTRTLGVPASAVAWSCIDVVALLAGLVLIGRQVGLRPRLLGWAVLAFTLTMPFLNELTSGQVQGVVILLLALSWRAFPRTSSGVLLGLAMAVKPVAPLLFLLPLLMRRPRVTLVAVGTFAAANAIFVPFMGLSAAGFYVIHFVPYLMSHVMVDPANLSLPYVLDVWAGGMQLEPWYSLSASPLHSMLLASALLWIIRGGVVLVLARAAWLRALPPVALFAAALALVPVMTSTAWPHYYLFLMPAVLVLLASPSLRLRVATGAVLAGSVITTTVLDIISPRLSPYPENVTVRHGASRMVVFVQSELMVLLSLVAFAAILYAATRHRDRLPQYASRRGGSADAVTG
jgi:alpha-1,2-mannosyltransferase